jgi:hypothetical protein
LEGYRRRPWSRLTACITIAMGVAVAVVAATQYINASLHEYLGMYISMTVDLHTLLYRKSMQYMYRMYRHTVPVHTVLGRQKRIFDWLSSLFPPTAALRHSNRFITRMVAIARQLLTSFI